MTIVPIPWNHIKAAHTPTPWCIFKDKTSLTTYIQPINEDSLLLSVAVVYGGAKFEQRANAEFIVLAVNAHADFVSELHAIANAKWDGITSQDFMYWAKSRARAALEKAGAA